MNKLSVFYLILLLMLGGLGFAQTLDANYAEFSQKDNIKPIDFCFKVSSSTASVTAELLFGTCADITDYEVRTDLPPGTVDGTNPVDFYILHASKAYDVFFTENGQAAEWIIVVTTQCVLLFTRKNDKLPDGSSLEFYQGASKLGDILANGSSFTNLAPGQYTIKYVPAPDQSTTEADVTFNFCPGWNLLHFPIVVYDKESNDAWKALDALPRLTLSGRSYVQGGEIRCGEAFWVFHNGPNSYSLTVLGYEPLPKDWSASKSGWNFTGTKNDTTINDIYEWANGQYQTSSSSDSSQGHWIYKK